MNPKKPSVMKTIKELEPEFKKAMTIPSLYFSPNRGNILVSSSRPLKPEHDILPTIQVWNIATGECIHTIETNLPYKYPNMTLLASPETKDIDQREKLKKTHLGKIEEEKEEEE
jgi:hypothetical protein